MNRVEQFVANGGTVEDLAWRYPAPTPEELRAQGVEQVDRLWAFAQFVVTRRERQAA